jgi:peptidoglycan/xylan/chitin deacetylase (PgdA/CDA1 family)
MAIKRQLLSVMHKAMYWSGLSKAYTSLRGICGSVILMYHSVPDAEARQWVDPDNAMPLERFEWQMEFLHRHRRVISMDELVAAVEATRELPVGTVVLTFDDGYRDNLNVVAPILQHYGFPAILYLPTEYINRGRTQFIDELYAIFTRRTVQMDLPAKREVVAALIDADIEGRERILTQLAEQFHPSSRPPRLTMNWDEVRELVRRYPNFQIGAHTAEHVDLRAHAEAAKVQIERCVADIERELRFRPIHFSFPYGRHAELSRRGVMEGGLKSAVVAGEDHRIGVRSNRFELVRRAAPESMMRFRSMTS